MAWNYLKAKTVATPDAQRNNKPVKTVKVVKDTNPVKKGAVGAARSLEVAEVTAGSGVGSFWTNRMRAAMATTMATTVINARIGSLYSRFKPSNSIQRYEHRRVLLLEISWRSGRRLTRPSIQ